MRKPFWMGRSSSICVLSAPLHLSHSFRTQLLLGVGQWIRSGSNAIRCFLHPFIREGFCREEQGQLAGDRLLGVSSAKSLLRLGVTQKG